MAIIVSGLQWCFPRVMGLRKIQTFSENMLTAGLINYFALCDAHIDISSPYRLAFHEVHKEVEDEVGYIHQEPTRTAEQ